LLTEVIAFAPKDLESVLFLLCNKVAPAFDNLEMGIGDSLLQKAVAAAFGKDVKRVKEAYEQAGDLGTVAEGARRKQKFIGFGAKPKALQAAKVLATYREICAIAGSKSQDAKARARAPEGYSKLGEEGPRRASRHRRRNWPNRSAACPSSWSPRRRPRPSTSPSGTHVF